MAGRSEPAKDQPRKPGSILRSRAEPAFDRWTDSYWLWDAYIAAGCVSIAVGLFFVDDDFAPRRVGAAVALAAIALAHAVVGRRIILTRERGVRAIVFVCVVVALFAAAVACAPAAMAAVVVMYPLLFMSLSLPAALAVTIAVTVLPLVIMVVEYGIGSDHAPVVAAITVLGVVVAPLIGTWITRTVTQSEERADLLDELAASRADVARLSRDAGTAAERARLAREIHDTLAQGFTSIVTLAQAAETEIETAPDEARRHIALAAATARENLAEARAMVAALTPSPLAAGTLVAAIRRQADRLARESGIAVVVDAPDELRRLPTAAEVVLLRSAQETLANIGRHAGASNVVVKISETAAGVLLRTSDDGVGFDCAASSGFGLNGMRARAEEAGGSFTVSSRPGRGTTVEVEVPA